MTWRAAADVSSRAAPVANAIEARGRDSSNLAAAIGPVDLVLPDGRTVYAAAPGVAPGASARCAVAPERVLVYPARERAHDCAAERQLGRTTLFAVPGVLVVLLLFIYPFLHGLVLSFEPKEGGGLANYRRFFSQPFLYDTIATTLRIAIPATLVNSGSRCRSLSRMRRSSARQLLTTILVLPITLGTVLVAEGLLTYLGPQGWVNRLLIESGLTSSPVRLTHNYWGVFLSLVITGFPFAFLLILSYVTGIDPALARAAATLGAGPGQQFLPSSCRCSRPGSRSPSASASSRLSRSSRPRYCWAPRPGRRGSSPSPLTAPPSRSTTIRWPRRSR